MRERRTDLLDRLAPLRDPSPEGARLRNRLGVAAAIAILLAGGLVAAGQAALVVDLLAVLLLVLGAGACVFVWRELGLSTRVARAGRSVGHAATRSMPHAGRAPALARRRTAGAAAALRPLAADLRATVGRRSARGRMRLGPLARTTGRWIERGLRALERRIGLLARRLGVRPAAGGQTLLANRLARGRQALGVELRRIGEPAEAAEQHRTARALYAAAGNLRGEALATNGLALALAAADETDQALVAYDRARALLHLLGDREQEAKVLANIAALKQRQGAGEEAETLLEAALAQLEPETPSYRLVERQLRRAS